MNIYNIIQFLTDEEIVDLMKFHLAVILENEFDAYECDILDVVADKLYLENKVMVKFESLDKKHAIILTMKELDYKLVKYDITFDYDVKSNNMESRKIHIEKLEDYHKFIAQKIDKKLGTFESDDYIKKSCKYRKSLEKSIENQLLY